MWLEMRQDSNVLLNMLYRVKGSSNLFRKVVDSSLVQARVFSELIVNHGSFSFGSSNYSFLPGYVVVLQRTG